MATEELTIDRAQSSDVDAVEALLDEAATWQQGRGTDLWSPGQFRGEIRQTIAAGNLHVARHEGTSLGVSCSTRDLQVRTESVDGQAGRRSLFRLHRRDAPAKEACTS